MGHERLIADAFGLGVPAGELEPVAGGGSHRTFRLRTSSGQWAVKRLNRSREAWWLRDFELAATIELAAYMHGIAMPRPVAPVRQGTSLLADLDIAGELVSFRVHQWCVGTAVRLDDEELQRWTGRTLAAVHGLPVSLPTEVRARPPLYPVTEWQAWLDDTHDVELAARARAALPDVTRTLEVVDAAHDALGDDLPMVVTHQDVRAHNMLLTATGPVLLDWDGAGPGHAQWEIVHAALDIARRGDHWDQEAFRRVVTAYENTTRRHLPRTPALFAGVLQAQLTAAQWTLWRALGHRPVTESERRQSRANCLAMLAELQRSLGHLGSWPDWLPPHR